MQNAECKMQNRRSFRIFRCAFCIGHFALLLAVVAACTSKETPSSTSQPSIEAPAIQGSRRPIVLPDLSSASETVQTLIRERYASLKLKIDSAETASGDLAAAYGDLGKLLIAAEYLDTAESCFSNAQALAATDMRWPYYRGHVERLRNEPSKAAAFFEETLRLQPDHVPSLIWLGEMYLAQSRLDSAESLFTKALSLQPRSAMALYGQGRVALAKQNYAQAVMHLEAALTISPQASRIEYPLAMAYRGKGDAQRAEAHLRRRGDVEVPSEDPLMAELGGLLQNASAYEVRGAQALGKRQWAEAVTYLRKAIELAPNDAYTHLNLGTALYMTGDGRGALEQFETAIRLSPDLSKAHYGIGVLMEARGRDREAIERFSAAVSAEPSYIEARMQLADALRRNGRLEESLPHYNEVIKTSPAISQARFGYAMALVRLRRYEEARDRLSDAMKTYPDQPGFAHALARILAAAPAQNVRDGPRAFSLMQDLLKQQKTIGLAETMAMTFAELGRFEEAVAWQHEAIAGAKESQRDAVSRLEQNLTLYENSKPCRTPWRDDDPVFHPRPQ
jgi:tetratricopeptide (TPR) repeat protein